MTDEDLNSLMSQLLRAQAYECNSPLNEIRVNTEGDAKDDGCDGWSAKPATTDGWLGAVKTCWQFKAGTAGEPARLKGEIAKRIPKETLRSGGRFVVVASGATSGKKGEEDRLKTLTREAKARGVPDGDIEVIGSERLALWCNQHPAIAARWAGRPDGLWTLNDWSSSDEHRFPWQASTNMPLDLKTQRADLDFANGAVLHLHIHGPPGVGKTRYALELCRGAEWRSAVIYVRQATDLRLCELLDGAAKEQDVRLFAVADEVEANQLRPLRDSVERGDGRIRLITIGHPPTPDPARIPALQIKPLDYQAMRKVVSGWYPTFPPEHVDFVVRFADGYVRLARLAAEAVGQNLGTNVRELLARSEIRGILDKMLGSDERHYLYVVAVLSRVGWTKEKQVEGEAIAKHFGFCWNTVRATVEKFHKRLNIVPPGGRYRYISPTPLAIYLAVEAWDTYTDVLRSLPNELPSEEARKAYYERLRTIASNPNARQFAREELSCLVHIDDFEDAGTVRRWSALSAAGPEQAACSIREALSGTSLESRARIGDHARRELVATLCRLSWQSSSFHDAAFALALLAAAENETWANSATDEFIARFQIILGGTAVPYTERLSVLDELLENGSASAASLAVKALAEVGNQNASRIMGRAASDELPEREWRPRTQEEYFECVEAALVRLKKIAQRGIPAIRDDFVAAANDLAEMLRFPQVQELVVGLFDTIRETYPGARESLRRIISGIIHHERNYSKTLSDQELSALDTLHTRFEHDSLAARLQQYIGVPSFDNRETPDLEALAKELLSAPQALREHWPWLTSGDAVEAWRLGETMASIDVSTDFAEAMLSFDSSGNDLRLLCGYISAKRRSLGNDWYDGWARSRLMLSPKANIYLFDVAWRCGVTKSVAEIIVEALHNKPIDAQIVDQLAFGSWDKDLPADIFEAILQAMVSTGHSATACKILERRILSDSSELKRWYPLALTLVTTPELIRNGHQTSYHWRKIAGAIVKEHSKEIADAILRELASNDCKDWFTDDAVKMLNTCARTDPAGVWQVLQDYLSSPINVILIIRLPRGLLEYMPRDAVTEWLSEQSEERAPIAARLTSTAVATDSTLASQILGEYGDNKSVAGAFFSQYVSGTFCGSISAHWEHLAEQLDVIANRTGLPKLRRWASSSARSLRQMAVQDRQHEEEEEIS